MALKDGKSKRVRLLVEIEIKGRETAEDAARDLDVMLHEITHSDDHWKALVLDYKIKPARR